VSAPTAESTPRDARFFGQPLGLATLFSTEFWERFSYYGMKAILLFYMYYETTKGGLAIPQATAAALVSIYGALIYMSQVLGGWIADRVLGNQRSVMTGAVIIMLGHITLSIPGGGAPALYVALLLIIMGTGLLKTNVSKVVGDLYDEKDQRRDAGFSLFYIGINAGAFLAPLVVGAVYGATNFHVGFACAAVGMAIGLVTYTLTRRLLGAASLRPASPLTAQNRGPVFRNIGIGLCVVVILVAIAGFFKLLTVGLLVNTVSVLSILLPIAYFTVMLRSPRTSAVEKSRLWAYIPLFITAVVFWLIEEQGSVVLAIFADQRTDLHAFGITLQPAFFQSINPLWVIILAPIFAWAWTKLGDRQPSTPHKFAYGVAIAGVSYLLLTLPGLIYGTGVKASPFWLVGSYFIVIVGEMLVSPVGLSATTKLAPAAFATQTMGLWFLSDAAAQGISAQIVGFYSASSEVAYFAIIGFCAIAVGVALYIATPAIVRKMEGVN
jgi:POT family proton-dependent oligopeptide transporter